MTAQTARPFPVPERPLTLLGVLDGAFAIMRTRPRAVAAIVAVFVLPTQLLSTWLQREALSSFSFDDFSSDTGAFGSTADSPEFGFFSGGPIAVIAPFVVLPFLGVALTHLVAGWRDGDERTVSDCLWFTVRRSHLILAALVVSKVVQACSLLFLTPATMLVAPVIAAEGVGPIRAMRRSIGLAKARYGNLLLLLLLLVVVNVLLSSALTTLPVLGASLLGDWGWVAFFALGLLSTSVLNVLGVGTSILAYLDLRNRVEGLDLQRRVAALVDADG